jgi:hypothetical protein
MATKRPNGHKIYQHLPLQGLPKCTQIWIFGLKVYRLAALLRISLLSIRLTAIAVVTFATGESMYYVIENVVQTASLKFYKDRKKDTSEADSLNRRSEPSLVIVKRTCSGQDLARTGPGLPDGKYLDQKSQLG